VPFAGLNRKVDMVAPGVAVGAVEGPPPVEGTAIRTACAAPVWRPVSSVYAGMGRARAAVWVSKGVYWCMDGRGWLSVVDIGGHRTCKGRAAASVVRELSAAQARKEPGELLQC
jgi:hypothetical protein